MSSFANHGFCRASLSAAVFSCCLGVSLAPAHAYVIYTGADSNGNPSVNLLSSTGIPMASAAYSSFMSSLTGVGTETFEGFSTGQSVPLSINFPGAGMATITGGSASIASVPAGATNGAGRYGISPSSIWKCALDHRVTSRSTSPRQWRPSASTGSTLAISVAH